MKTLIDFLIKDVSDIIEITDYQKRALYSMFELTLSKKDKIEISENKCNCESVIELFNDMFKGILPKARLTTKRKTSIVARFKESGYEGIRTVFENTLSSDFLTGKKTDWKANFDFMFSKSGFTKIIEGNYGNGDRKNKEQNNRVTDDYKRSILKKMFT